MFTQLQKQSFCALRWVTKPRDKNSINTVISLKFALKEKICIIIYYCFSISILMLSVIFFVVLFLIFCCFYLEQHKPRRINLNKLSLPLYCLYYGSNGCQVTTQRPLQNPCVCLRYSTIFFLILRSDTL